MVVQVVVRQPTTSEASYAAVVRLRPQDSVTPVASHNEQVDRVRGFRRVALTQSALRSDRADFK